MSKKVDEEPGVDLGPEQVVCRRHGDPFRVKWPKGFPAFTHTAFAVVMMDEVFIREVKMLSPNNNIQEELAAVEQLLAQVPLCCRMAPPDLFQVYREVNLAERVWERAECGLCGRVGYGSSFRQLTPNGDGFLPLTYHHICLRCVCFTG